MMEASTTANEDILVVAVGIRKTTSALETAGCGKRVVLVEKPAALGERTALLCRH